MNKLKAYFKSKDWKWYLSNGLFVICIVILIVPSWRLKFSTMVNQLFLSEPSITKIEAPVQSNLNWPMTDLNSKEINLTQSKGKVVFINAWATWCGPCRSELPSMEKLYTKYKNDVDFYFISTESVEPLIRFNEKMEYTFPIYSSQFMPKELEASTIPTSFILDKDRNVVFRKKGTANWNSEAVHKFLDELIAN